FEGVEFLTRLRVVDRAVVERNDLDDLARGLESEGVGGADGSAYGAGLLAGVGVVGGGGLAADQELALWREMNGGAIDGGGREVDYAHVLPRLVAFGDPGDGGGGEEDQDQGVVRGFEKNGAPGGVGGLVRGVVEGGHAR